MKTLKKGIFNISDSTISWGMAFVGLAAVAAAGVGLYVKVYSTSAVTTMNTILNESKSLRVSTGYGNGDLIPALIRSGSIPKDVSIIGDKIYNAAGGQITLVGNGIGIIATTNGVKGTDCMKLATTLSNGDIASTKINGSTAIAGEISPAQAAAACVAGKENTITFTTNM
ncbi:type 4 pilus major pilin [Xenorhabdus bovienii]|uniref:type 4 pilus major pilin n=1 Tax=Xenorhabdus bovienii TaxID=40576 RepID=UPI003DA6505B